MPQVIALSGGVGGAKLSLGLQRTLPPGALAVIVNTADDFRHLGLEISPDIDTTLYTLGGVVNPVTGWGRAEETWSFMAELERFGGDTWFRLGDRDLVLHVERTRRLRTGEPLDAIVQDFACRLGLSAQVLPMSNDPVRTVLDTDIGRLEFQDYFVRRACAPIVRGIRYEHAATARIPSRAPDLDSIEAIVICPSNPYLSIDPILAIPAWRSALLAARAPIVAVSPVIAGSAVKGPTAKIMGELGVEVSSLSVAHHYSGLLDGFVVDAADSHLAQRFDVPVLVTSTIMRTIEDKERLARETLQFARSISCSNSARRVQAR